MSVHLRTAELLNKLKAMTLNEMFHSLTSPYSGCSSIHATNVQMTKIQ